MHVTFILIIHYFQYNVNYISTSSKRLCVSCRTDYGGDEAESGAGEGASGGGGEEADGGGETAGGG